MSDSTSQEKGAGRPQVTTEAAFVLPRGLARGGVLGISEAGESRSRFLVSVVESRRV